MRRGPACLTELPSLLLPRPTALPSTSAWALTDGPPTKFMCDGLTGTRLYPAAKPRGYQATKHKLQQAPPPSTLPDFKFEWGCLPVKGLTRANTSATKHNALNRGGGEPEGRGRRGSRYTTRTACRASGAAAAADRASCGQLTIARNSAGPHPQRRPERPQTTTCLWGRSGSGTVSSNPSHQRHSLVSAFAKFPILEVGVGSGSFVVVPLAQLFWPDRPGAEYVAPRGR